MAGFVCDDTIHKYLYLFLLPKLTGGFNCSAQKQCCQTIYSHIFAWQQTQLIKKYFFCSHQFTHILSDRTEIGNFHVLSFHLNSVKNLSPLLLVKRLSVFKKSFFFHTYCLFSHGRHLNIKSPSCVCTYVFIHISLCMIKTFFFIHTIESQ